METNYTVEDLTNFEKIFNVAKELTTCLDAELDLRSRVAYTREEMEKAVLKKIKKVSGITQRKLFLKVQNILINDETRKLDPELLYQVCDDFLKDGTIKLNKFEKIERGKLIVGK